DSCLAAFLGLAGWWSEPVTVLAAPGGLARFMRLWPPVYPLSPLSTGDVQKLRGHPEPRGLHRVQAPRLPPRLHLPHLHHPPPAATAHNPPPRTRVQQAHPHLRRHTRRQHRRHHRTPNKEEEGKRRTGDSPSFSQPTPALQAPTRRLWTTPNQSQQPDQHPQRSRTQRPPTDDLLDRALPARAKPERRTNHPPPRAPHPQRPRERHPRHRQRIP